MASPAVAAPRGRSRRRQAWEGLGTLVAGADIAPQWGSRWRRLATYGALALLALVSFVVSTAPDQPGLRVLYGGWEYLQNVPITAGFPVVALLLVAAHPLWSWRIAWLALLINPILEAAWGGVGLWHGSSWDPAQLCALLVSFCVVGVRHGRVVLGWMWALTLAGWWAWTLPLFPWEFHTAYLSSAWWGVIGTGTFAVVALMADAVGSALRARRVLAGEVEETALARAGRTVLEERAQIAREMHDVVAHHMSLMAVRAESAPFRLAGLDDSAAAEFRVLSGAVRAAMTDMRQLLGVLRDGRPPERAPQPTLADVPALVAGARAAGLVVDLSMLDGLERIPSAVGLGGYRIVQEALANALRQAPGSAVSVTVAAVAGELVVRVVNAAPGWSRPRAGVPRQAGPAANGTAGKPEPWDLAGVRERVALLGGTLSAGPSPDGGYEVFAALPTVASASVAQPSATATGEGM